MKLERLRVERLAGIESPFEIADLGPGLNIIIGPNGIGKSRVCATVRALLWSERDVAGEGLAARAEFEHEGVSWQVVRDGSLHRWQREGLDTNPPTLPGQRLDACFFLGLRDLLDDSERAGRDLASEIRKQMSGGFDLDAAEGRFSKLLTKTIGKKESKSLSEAEKDVRRAELGQSEVQRRERELESLESQAVDAERAAQRLAAFTTAIALQELRADHAQQAKELAGLPEALSRLDGKEVLRLDKLVESLGQKRSACAEAIDDLERSVDDARKTRLDSPIDPVLIETWRERADKLTELEGRIETATVAAVTAREAFRERREMLGIYSASQGTIEDDSGAESDLESPFGIEDDFDLFAFLRESQHHANEREVLVERLRLLGERVFSEDEARRLELLRRGVEPLRRWLRAPDPGLDPGDGRAGSQWRNLAIVGVVLAAVGLVMRFAAVLEAQSLLAIGAGIGLGIAALLSRMQSPRDARESDSTDWRTVAVRQFPELLGPPEQWTPAAVEERLIELEDELANHDADQKRARDRGVERRQLEETLKGLEERLRGLEARRGVLYERLGLDTLRPDVEMVDLARALDAARSARVAAGEAAANLKELSGQRSRLLLSLAESLIEHGEPEPVDGASARAGVHSLETRDRSLRDATTNQSRETRNRDRFEAEIASLDADQAEIFHTAGIESRDRGELTRLLSHLDRFRALDLEIAKTASVIERSEQDLDAIGEAGLAADPLAKLQEELALLGKRSADRDKLRDQIRDIRGDALQARSGHVLEKAIADKSAAMTALRGRREEALLALTGQTLVESVRREHETHQMPRVLERAREHFARFTHHRYRLEVTPGDGGSFVAVDAKSSEGLPPNKLSDGTRAQLILAARLAFAEEAEHGADLPLFLDEAMDHSDPERFHAIAEGLADMVGRKGRQIFYFTNDPTDIERFASAFKACGGEPPKVLDLAAIRGQGASLDTSASLRVDPLPEAPTPSGQDAESYGIEIGVSALDPSRDAFGQHLYYVLRDDLALLHRLLEARVTSVGQCLNVLRGESALARSVVAGSDVGAGLKSRIELLNVFCLAWREGRGLSFGRLELEESKAVTDKYIDAFVEVSKELDGDARRLMAHLREKKDSRLSGFRSKSAEVLEQYFLEQGHLDDRVVLGEDELIQRALGAPAADQLSPSLTAELVHQWWKLSAQTPK